MINRLTPMSKLEGSLDDLQNFQARRRSIMSLVSLWSSVDVEAHEAEQIIKTSGRKHLQMMKMLMVVLTPTVILVALSAVNLER